MKKNLLFVFAFIILSWNAEAARPTMHSSNLSSTDITCNSLTITWTVGNGSARIILMREGALPDYTPIDGTIYTGYPAYGAFTQYGNSGKVSVVYNGGGKNSTTITNLDPKKTYYWTIFEHDNSGINTQYYTTNAPSQSVTTYDIQFDFTAVATDSCEASNTITFTNTSTTSMTGVTYYFVMNNYKDTIQSNQFSHKLTGKGLIPVFIYSVPTLIGCPNSISKLVKIFPKKMATLNKASFKDSIQYFEGNYFTGTVNPITQNFPMGVLYTWDFKDSSISNFTSLKHSYKKEGVYRVSLELTATSYNQLTACKDTLYQTLVVKHDAFLNMLVYPTPQYIDSNVFYYANVDSTITYQKWTFGDGDSTVSDTARHTYSDTGIFKVTNYVETNFGYKGSRSVFVRVLPTKVKDSTGTQLFRIVNTKNILLYPNPAVETLYLALEHPEEYRGLTIYDMQGKKLMEVEVISSQIELSLQKLAAGEYTLQLMRNDNSSEFRQFIVVKTP